MAYMYHVAMCFKKNLTHKIHNIWININPKGSSNEWHEHPHSVLSGSFYVKVNTPIVFRHPYSDINNYFWRYYVMEDFILAISKVFWIAVIIFILILIL